MANIYNEQVLDVRDLKTYFFTKEGVVKAVDGLTYHVNKGECVGLVGESACGKSVGAMSVLPAGCVSWMRFWWVSRLY